MSKTLKKETRIKNISILWESSKKSLRAEEITKTFDVSKEESANIPRVPVNTETKILNFPLKKVSLERLSEYKEKCIPIFVLKIGKEFYYTKIPYKMNLVGYNLLWNLHICATKGKACRRLSSATDENGGCAKVRNFSKNIEKYPWITKGYETVNTIQDCMFVAECLNFEL